MKKLLKKVLPIALVALVAIIPAGNAFANDVAMEGQIAATVLSIDIPLSASFSIDPNADEADVFQAPILTITSTTSAPIVVTLSGFNLETAGFVSVAPDTFADWKNLTVSESKNIAIGVKPGAGWATSNAATLWADQAASVDAEIGTIAPGASATLEFEAMHGYAFAESHTLNYSLSLSIGLLN